MKTLASRARVRGPVAGLAVVSSSSLRRARWRAEGGKAAAAARGPVQKTVEELEAAVTRETA